MPFEDSRETYVQGIPEEDQQLLLNLSRMIRRERGNTPEVRSQRELLTRIRAIESSNVQIIEFDSLIHHLHPEIIYSWGSTLSAIQLTTGCSIGCPSCALGALKKVRRKLSWNSLEKIITTFSKNIPESIFY